MQKTIPFAIIALTLLFSASGCQFAARGQNAQGVRMFNQGQYSAALQQFQQAIASNPQSADGYYNLAATTHRLGKERSDQNLQGQAESLYNQCLDLDPNHVDCHRGLAVLLVETNRPDRAFALLRNWATASPQISDAKIELARLYQEFGEGQMAQKFLEDSIAQDPNSSRAWLALGQLRESSGNLQQALQDYQRSYNLNTMQPQIADRIASLNQQLVAQNLSQAAPQPQPTQLAQPNVGQVSRGRY